MYPRANQIISFPSNLISVVVHFPDEKAKHFYSEAACYPKNSTIDHVIV